MMDLFVFLVFRSGGACCVSSSATGAPLFFELLDMKDECEDITDDSSTSILSSSFSVIFSNLNFVPYPTLGGFTAD